MEAFLSVVRDYPFLTPFLTATGAVLVAIAAFLKFRPERDSLIVQASEHAVQAMQTAMENLQHEVHELRDKVARQSAMIEELRRQTDVSQLIAILPRVQKNAEQLDAIHDLLFKREAEAK